MNPKPEDNPAQAAAPAAPPAPAKAPVGTPLPTIEDLPQYKFARSVEKSPVAGGSAESRYLTIIYGMIKEHLRESSALHLDLANRHGLVDFYIDEGGNLVGRKLVSFKRVAEPRHRGDGGDRRSRAISRAPALVAYLPQLQLRPHAEAEGRRGSLNAEVVHPDFLEIWGPVAPVIGRPHSVFRAFLRRLGVELRPARERVTVRRIGIVEERDVAIA